MKAKSMCYPTQQYAKPRASTHERARPQREPFSCLSENFQELFDFFQELFYILIMSKFNDACEKILRPKGDLVVLPLEDLPNDVNNLLWVRIEQTYGLSLPELIALQNYSTARTGNKIYSISLY